MKKFVMMIVALALACAPLAAQVRVGDATAEDMNTNRYGLIHSRSFSVRQGRPIYASLFLSVDTRSTGTVYEIQLSATGNYPQAPDGMELNIDGEVTVLRTKVVDLFYNDEANLPRYALSFDVDRKLFERLRVTNQMLTFTVLVGNQRYQTVTVGGEARQKFNTQMFKIMSDQELPKPRW